MNKATRGWLRKLGKSRAFRESQGLVFVEGTKTVLDLGLEFVCVYSSVGAQVQEHLHCQQFQEASVEELSSVLPSMNGPTLCGVLPKPKPSQELGKRVLVLDRLQDPGNVGTLLRTAYSLGWDGVFCIEPICDLFHPKVLRASQGASFHLPYCQGSWSQMVEMARKHQASILVADMGGEEVERHEGAVYVVLGQEGSGVSIQGHYDKKVCVAMDKGESLNVAVAGGILLYVL